MYAINKGTRTSKISDSDSCRELGLQLVIPRTEAHFAAMIRQFGPKYFSIVPGIYGLKPGDYSSKPMNSEDLDAAMNWLATDGGTWFIRSTPFSQPSGDYTKGCWLGMTGWTRGHYKFDDKLCKYSATQYICSTNDKGGWGINLAKA